MKQKNLLIALAVVVILAGLWWWLGQGKQANAPEETNTTPNADQNEATDNVPEPGADGTATNQLPTTNDAVAVSDQASGSSNTIDNYVLNKAGFIVIHEVTSENSPGTIVGQSGLLKEGRGQDLEITAKVSAGKEYMAMIHVDNGDKKFSASQDSPAMSGGNMIIATFKIVE